jgi:alpha-beta hydrolase superfamily lysophospholipase
LPFFILAHSMGTLVASLAIKDLPFVKVRTNDYPTNQPSMLFVPYIC